MKLSNRYGQIVDASPDTNTYWNMSGVWNRSVISPGRFIWSFTVYNFPNHFWLWTNQSERLEQKYCYAKRVTITLQCAGATSRQLSWPAPAHASCSMHFYDNIVLITIKRICGLVCVITDNYYIGSLLHNWLWSALGCVSIILNIKCKFENFVKV